MSLGPLFVTKNLCRMGSGWALESLLQQLPCPVRVCTLSGPTRLDLSGIPLFGSDKPESSWWRFIKPLLEEIKREYSPVIAWGQEAITRLGWLKRLGLIKSKTPLIGYWDTFDLPTWKEKPALKNFDELVTPHPETVQGLQKFTRDRVRCLTHTRPELDLHEIPKLETGLRCGWIGELDTPQRAREAIWFFAVYAYTNHDSTLTILGEGDYLEAHRICNDLFAGDRKEQTRFQTPSKSLKDDLSRFNLLLVPPTNDDPTPLILKAMSLGVVVFVARSPITERLIQHHKNGVLYTGGDIHQAGKLLVELDQNRSMINTLGEAAKTTIEQMADGVTGWRNILGISEGVKVA